MYQPIYLVQSISPGKVISVQPVNPVIDEPEKLGRINPVAVH